MVEYLILNHPNDDVIVSKDPEMIELLTQSNYEKLDWIDPIAKFSLTSFQIPETTGYEIKSLEEDYRLEEIHYALWKGFGHGDDISYDAITLMDRKHMTSSPNLK